jgi:putative ABC transport system permease protein
MKPGSLVRASIRALGRQRLRSGFIMLASLVGVTALTFVLTLGQGVQRKMLATARQIFGDSSIVIVTGGQNLIGGPRPDAARLTIDDVAAAAAAVPEIEVWDPQQVLNASVRHGGASTSVRVLGQSERSARVWSRDAARGRFFDAPEVKRMERVALIGETVARNLFGATDPLNAEILIESVPFTVVGVLERFGTDLHGMDRDNEIVVPVSTLQRRLANVDTISVAKLLLSDTSQLERTSRAVRDALRSRHALRPGQPDDFQLLTPVEVRQLMGRMQRILAVYLPLASVVVLFVGGIVAATLMLGAVNARIGEIGLRRAVGAQPRDIGWQFVTETTVTMLGGGLLGVTLGVAAAQILATHLKMSPVFSWAAVAIGLALSIVTGLLAGVLPARRAARLPPAEALR